MANLENDISRMDIVNNYDRNLSVAECKDFFSGRMAEWCGSEDAGRVIGGLDNLLRLVFEAGARDGGLDAAYTHAKRDVKSDIDKAYPLHKTIMEMDIEPIYKAMIGVEILLMVQRIKLLGHGYGEYHSANRRESENPMHLWAALSRYFS